MATRHILHLSKLDDFAGWAATRGYRRAEAKGDYEALRLVARVTRPLSDRRKRTLIYHERLTGDHATFPDTGPEGALVRRWIRERGD